LKSICHREIQWLDKYADSKPQQRHFLQHESSSSPEVHISLYKKLLDVADYVLPPQDDLTRPTIRHSNLYFPNIFVDGTKITCVANWQDVWAGPLFLQAQRPRLVIHHGEMVLELPPNYEDIVDENEKAGIRDQLEKSVLVSAYDSHTKLVNPILDEILQIPHGQTRFQTVIFASNTWDSQTLNLRQCLIRIRR
jgi:hypothetical protein